MITLYVLRHAPTAWNALGRMQGRRDVPLSDAGRVAARRWRLPLDHGELTWVASPLSRAVETATLMRGTPPEPVAPLIEMDWGEWEGETLDDLARRDPVRFAELEAQGLDFRPPGGESPRQVLARVRAWLASRADGERLVAVTHNGVVRALLAGATGWDMLGKPPVRLRPACAHRFSAERDGTLELATPNIPLAGAPL